MKSLTFILLQVSLLILQEKISCLAALTVAVNRNTNHVDRTRDIDAENALLVGLSRSSLPSSVPLRPNAIEDAVKLLQTIVDNILERLLDLQQKVYESVTLSLSQIFRFSSVGTAQQNDHVSCDVESLGLTANKLKMIHDISAKQSLHSEGLCKRANATHFTINPHLIFRYLAAADWAKKYNGRSYEEAISDTVEWREQFGITTVDTSKFAHLVRNGLGYTGGFDKHGRAIVYVKIGRNEKLEDSVTYQKLLMYTVERADRMCVQSGSGEFVAVIDLEGFKWSNSLPIPLIKDAVTLLKRHYPYRLGGVFILNGSAAFTLLWSIIKPIMPRKTLSKTFVINKKQIKKTMCDKLGKEYAEEAYGGDVKEDHDDVIKYFASGYWGK